MINKLYKFIIAFILILSLACIPVSLLAEDARLQLTADGLTMTKDGVILGTVIESVWSPGAGRTVVIWLEIQEI